MHAFVWVIFIIAIIFSVALIDVIVEAENNCAAPVIVWLVNTAFAVWAGVLLFAKL